MKRIPLILSPALLLLLPVIALYPMLHASAEKDGVDSSTAIQEAAPSESAQPPHRSPPQPPHRKPPRRKPPRRTAPSLPPPLPPPLPSPSVVLSTPMIFPSPTASSRRFTAI